MIKISIIIATYNTAQYIEECLLSIISQTLQPIEVIVIDDGSTDETELILKKYKEKYPYLRVLYQENYGQAVAINRALEYVRGEYIAFMDPDDKYPCDDCLERLYYAAKSSGALMCGGNVILNDYKDGKIKKGYTAGDGDDNRLKNCYISVEDYYYLYGHTRYLYDSKMIKENNIKHGVYRRYGDQVLTLGAMIAAGKIYELDYPVYEYRVNHYPEIYDEQTWLDIFKAFKDTISFMIQHDMKKMYKKNVYNVYKSWIAKVYKWINGNEEWKNIIDDIQNTMIKSGWSYENELIYKTIEKVELETKKTEEVFDLGMPLVIYGAGTNTGKFVEKFSDRINLIKGIAVTNIDKNEEKYGFKVKPLKDFIEFKDEIIVIVTPEGDVGSEMYEYACMLGYKNIKRIDMQFVGL